MSVLLSLQSITKSFAHKPLFAELSLDLRVGEKVGLIGPNGAGKSTLLKILAGLEVPDEGSRSVRRGARIGYLPQDDEFPAGEDPLEEGVDPALAVTFDITEDQPDNELELPGGGTAHIAPFESDGEGGAIVRLYGDLKRHDMGTGLAEAVNENNIGRSTFLTENLWGVGTTAPYLHDGRCLTLEDTVEFFNIVLGLKLTAQEKTDLVAFMRVL